MRRRWMHLGAALVVAMLSNACGKERIRGISPENEPTVGEDDLVPDDDSKDDGSPLKENDKPDSVSESEQKDGVDITKLSGFRELCDTVKEEQGENRATDRASPALKESTIRLFERIAETSDCAAAEAALAATKKISLDGKDETKLVDLRPFYFLTHLEELKLANNKITNLTSLTGLKQLIKVDLSHNDLTESHKDIHGNEVRNLAMIAKESLTSLKLTGNKITDIADLAEAVNLEVLDLSNNQIKDYSPLAALTNLKILNVLGNPDLEGQKAALETLIAKIPGLEIDFITLNNLPPFVEYCKDRSSLSAAQSHSFDVILGLDELGTMAGDCEAVFDFFRNGVVNESGERVFLTNLRLNRKGLSDISLILAPLSISVTKLFLKHNELVDIEAIGSLTKLTNLDLTCNKDIADFKPLGKLTQLKSLSLKGIPLTLEQAEQLTSFGLGDLAKKLTVLIDGSLKRTPVFTELSRVFKVKARGRARCQS